MAGKFSIPRGTFDVLPKDSYKWELIESKFRQIAKRFGYKEIVTPIFENSEVFERSVGDTSDIVQKEMYKFTDKKGRTFALRPEGTAPVIRSYVENNLGADNPISKLMYIGPMFRYDRPQAGRSRQFSQFGVECIGSNHPY
ncbi:MAG TPA: ATP phosphoribosyltransferase regulatory subunit, partial [Candidatus Cloacimonadota bacterium]|nr:ATP phosphoribosyltransferase regulatory subunit [Candidatus Cloacimonadota bacterium]